MVSSQLQWPVAQVRADRGSGGWRCGVGGGLGSAASCQHWGRLDSDSGALYPEPAHQGKGAGPRGQGSFQGSRLKDPLSWALYCCKRLITGQEWQAKYRRSADSPLFVHRCCRRCGRCLPAGPRRSADRQVRSILSLPALLSSA